MRETPAFESVKFVGFPIGMADEAHNIPIVRTGICATDPSIDYNGTPVFLIDGSVYPGSSGSPVYYAEEGVINLKHGIGVGSRIHFLGILYAVNQYTIDGHVQVVSIPTAYDFKAISEVPAGLGLVMKPRCLTDFEQFIVNSAIHDNSSLPMSGITNSVSAK